MRIKWTLWEAEAEFQLLTQSWLAVFVGVTVLGCTTPERKKINEATAPVRHGGKVSQELRTSSESHRKFCKVGKSSYSRGQRRLQGEK